MNLFKKRSIVLPPKDLHAIEEVRRKLDKISLEAAKSYEVSNINFRNFSDWVKAASELRDPDVARNVLYFGFQPLYDALIEEKVDPDLRGKALEALDKIMDLSISFLKGYYTGEPDVTKLREDIAPLRPLMEELKDVPYRTKFRNVDYNGIYPSGILTFLRESLDHSLDGKLFLPEYIVGCACGSSEVVMPFAGLSNSSLGFIRRSFRRGDDSPKMIREHKERFQRDIKGKKTICVEDYVCTGGSLKKVMEATRKYEPAILIGAAVNGRAEPDYLKADVLKHKFKLYTIK
ncbi:MAG: phosphoribosyltransferase family protein [Nanoarchaeota archaeon]|nr:phosphoribosyltransferase family protein [Nanoarchaeota archaeon]